MTDWISQIAPELPPRCLGDSLGPVDYLLRLLDRLVVCDVRLCAGTENRGDNCYQLVRLHIHFSLECDLVLVFVCGN